MCEVFAVVKLKLWRSLSSSSRFTFTFNTR